MNLPPPSAKKEIDRTKLRLSVLGVLVFAMFVGLFSRLWFLQVLAKEQFVKLANENTVRLVYSEPPRGRILDAKNRVLVENRTTYAVTISHRLREGEGRVLRSVVRRLSRFLKVPERDINRALEDGTVSPYKPIPVVTDVKEPERQYIMAHRADLFPGVSVEAVPVRVYPYGGLASHVLGWVNEITPEQLDSTRFSKADVKPDYAPGDIVGQDGIELIYDRHLRGTPQVRKFIVNASGSVIRSQEIQEEEPGADVKLTLDIEAQRLVESALEGGLFAGRAHGYPSPAGAAVVMDPKTGGIVAMASYPDYNVAKSANGWSEKEWREINGSKTPKNPDDDKIINRAAMAQRAPGSTFKAITMAAALATGVADYTTALPCPGSVTYPPNAPPGAGTQFFNWTTTDLGTTDVPRSLRISCNTFYYQLGWDMETTFGENEDFQKYAQLMGIGHDTGIDLPYEADGRVPNREWCREAFQATKGTPFPTCKDGWLPGYTVNMAIGQGDLITNPLQMAVAYGSIANGGKVMVPRLAEEVAFSVDKPKDKDVVLDPEPTVRAELGLDEAELATVQQGLTEVISHGEGTAREAFSGFPYSAAGKTGTAQLGDTGLNDAWFISYGPAVDAKYVVGVYVEKSGHGGESAAPIARQIFEGLLGGDKSINITFGEDSSG
jgi:penicillin-binding protein 2